jgi:hypothetical protein
MVYRVLDNGLEVRRGSYPEMRNLAVQLSRPDNFVFLEYCSFFDGQWCIKCGYYAGRKRKVSKGE